MIALVIVLALSSLSSLSSSSSQHLIVVQAAHSRRRPTMHPRSSTSSDRRYDRSVTTFDPTGRLRQVEHAWTASERGDTVVAAIVGDVIYVVTVGKPQTSSSLSQTPKVQPLQLGPSSSSTYNHNHHHNPSIWSVTAGLSGDAQYWTEQLRSIVRQYRLESSDFNCSLSTLARLAAERQHALTVTPGRRPLGIATLLLGLDNANQKEEPRLFRCRAGGIREDCRYCAVGQRNGAVQAALAECYEELIRRLDTLPVAASASWHYEIVTRLVQAVQQGLGQVVVVQGENNSKDDEDCLEMSVWVFPKPLSGHPNDQQPICFTGIRDAESLARVQTFWTAQQQQKKEREEEAATNDG